MPESAQFCPSCGRPIAATVGTQRTEQPQSAQPTQQPTQPTPQPAKQGYFAGMKNSPYWHRARSYPEGMIWYILLVGYQVLTAYLGLIAFAMGYQGLGGREDAFCILSMILGLSFALASVLGIYYNFNFKKKQAWMVLTNLSLQLIECVLGIIMEPKMAGLWLVIAFIVAMLWVVHFFYFKHRMKYLEP